MCSLQDLYFMFGTSLFSSLYLLVSLMLKEISFPFTSLLHIIYVKTLILVKKHVKK